MKLFLKLIGPILWFSMAVVMNTSLALDFYDRPVLVIILVAFLSAFMSVITGMYVELVIGEHYEVTLKELKEEKDEN